MADDEDVWATMIHMCDLLCGAVETAMFPSASMLSVEAASLRLSQDFSIRSAGNASGPHNNPEYTDVSGEPAYANNCRAWCQGRSTAYMGWPFMDRAGTRGVWYEFEVKGSGARGRQSESNAKIYALRQKRR